MPRILILAPYPWNEAPSQRFRFELLLKNKQEKGLQYSFGSFYSIKGWEKLYQTTHPIAKLWLLLAGFGRRKLHLIQSLSYPIILIHRELTPIGPPIFEWILAKIFRKKIIFDFDDAIWMNDGHDSRLSWWLKSRWKIKKICQWSWKVSAGNEFLADYARKHCSTVSVIPTIVDTTLHKPKAKSSKTYHHQLTIGWTGSHSTLFYLDTLIPILQQLQEKHDFTFLLIANVNPQLPLKNYRFIKWNEQTEIEDLQQIDIGIMPLEETEWAKGKCGFKLIQYGALGIPSVAAPVGVNPTILMDKKTGYLVRSASDWTIALSTLLEDPALREKMGLAARERMINNYSLEAVQGQFEQLFKH